MRSKRLARGLAASLSLAASLPAQAQTDEDKLRCVDAYEQSQRDRRDGRLLEARRQLLVCSQEVCPEVVSNDCATWLGEVERSVPSVVVSARSPAGDDLIQARVSIDEALVSSALDGKAVELDPGQHRLQIEVEGYLPYDRTLVVAEGEKHRSIIVTLERPPGTEPVEPPPQPDEPSARPSPAVPVVLGVVGTAGFVGLTYFGATARSAERDLDSCHPNCPQVDVDNTKQRYLMANVSLGVGVAGAAGTVIWLLATRPRGPATTRRPRVELVVGQSGAGATVRGRF